MIKFDCKYHFDWERYERTWQGTISGIVYFGSHMELVVQTNEPVTIIVGKTSSGYFIYFKSHVTGTDLPSLFDVNRNISIISDVCFDEVKAATVAFAINRVGNLLSHPRKKNKVNNAGDGAGGFYGYQ